jgi:hypothetical protein
MPSTDEDHALQLWFRAYEPAVDVEITPEEVRLRSTRPRRMDSEVRCRRTTDLHQDLTSALRLLVARLS